MDDLIYSLGIRDEMMRINKLNVERYIPRYERRRERDGKMQKDGGIFTNTYR